MRFYLILEFILPISLLKGLFDSPVSHLLSTTGVTGFSAFGFLAVDIVRCVDLSCLNQHCADFYKATWAVLHILLDIGWLS